MITIWLDNLPIEWIKNDTYKSFKEKMILHDMKYKIKTYIIKYLNTRNTDLNNIIDKYLTEKTGKGLYFWIHIFEIETYKLCCN